MVCNGSGWLLPLCVNVPEFQKGYRKILCCHRKSRIIQVAPWSSVEPFRSSLPLVPRRQFGVTLSGQATAMKADKTGEGRRGHPAWSSVNLDCSSVYQSILTTFYNDGLWEKIYFEAYISNQYIWHKNNTAKLYFILESLQFFQFT